MNRDQKGRFSIGRETKYKILRGSALFMCSVCALYGLYIATLQGLDAGAVAWVNYRGLPVDTSKLMVSTEKQTVYVIDKAESDKQVSTAVNEALK